MPLAQRVRLCLFVAILIAIVATPLVVFGAGPVETASEWAVMAAFLGAMVVWTWFGPAWVRGVKANTLEAQEFRRKLAPEGAGLIVAIGAPTAWLFFVLVVRGGGEFLPRFVVFVLTVVPITVAFKWTQIERLLELRRQAKSPGASKQP